MVMSAEAVCAAEGSKMSTCTITSGKNASGEQAICGMLGPSEEPCPSCCSGHGAWYGWITGRSVAADSYGRACPVWVLLRKGCRAALPRARREPRLMSGDLDVPRSTCHHARHLATTAMEEDIRRTQQQSVPPQVPQVGRAGGETGASPSIRRPMLVASVVEAKKDKQGHFAVPCPCPFPCENNRHQITILPLKTKRKSPMEKKLKMGIRPCIRAQHSLRTSPGRPAPPLAPRNLREQYRTSRVDKGQMRTSSTATLLLASVGVAVAQDGACCHRLASCGGPLCLPTGTGSLQRVRVARRGWVGGSGWERQPQGW
jgi:hypothetical protein